MASKDEINLRITAKDDASKVIDKIDKKAKALEKLTPEVVVDADDNASPKLEDVEAAAKRVDGMSPTINADAETTAAQGALSDLEAVAERVDGSDPTISADAQVTDAKASLEDVLTLIGRLDAENAQVVLALRGAEVQAELGNVLVDIARINGSPAEIDIKIENANRLKSEFDQITSAIEKLEGAKVDIPVKADTKQAEKSLRDLEGDVKSLQDKLKSASDNKLNINTGNFEAGMQKAIQDVEEFADKVRQIGDQRARLSITTEIDETGLKDLQSDIDLLRSDFRSLEADIKAAGAAGGGDFDDIANSLDDIKAGLDGVSTAQSGLSDMGGNARAAAGDLDQVGKSADSSKSVLANMVGNATQDLGTLGGVAGSAGVAIGQMGEYMADAKASGEGWGSIISSFSSVALPIAGISLAIGLVTTAIQNHKKRQEEMEKAVRATTKAFEDGVGSLDDWKDALEDSITEGTADAGEAFNKFMVDALEGAGHLEDVQEALGQLDMTFDDLGTTLIAADADFDQWATGFLKGQGVAEDLAQTIADVIDETKDFDDIIAILNMEGIDTSGMEETIRALNEIDDAVGDLDLEKSAKQFLDSEAAISADTAARVANAREGTQSQIDALENYIAATIAANAADKERTAAEEAQEEALTAMLEALKEAAAAQEQFKQSVEDANITLLDAEASSDAFAEALERVNEASELDFSLMALDTVQSFDDMKDALKELEDVAVDWSTVDLTPDSVEELKGIPDELAAVTEGISGMRDSIQTELQAAFDTGGIDAYTAKAEFFRAEILDQFPAKFREVGASEDEAAAQAQALADELGLMPEDIQIMIQLTREEEARNALAAFSDVISQMPRDVQVAINTAIAEGDIEGALAILNEQLIHRGYEPIMLPVDANIAPAEGQVQGFANADQPAATVPIEGDPEPAEGTISDVEEGDYEASVGVNADTAVAAAIILGFLAMPRKANIYVDLPNVQAANTILNTASGNRDSNIGVTTSGVGAANTAIDNAARNRTSTITVRTVTQHEAGGTAGPYGGIAGEAGPELVNGKYMVLGATYVPPGSKVTSTKRTREMIRRGDLPHYANGTSAGTAGIGASPVVNINVNAAVVGNRFDVMRAVSRAGIDAQRLLGSRT